MDNTITISLEQYNEYIILKERMRLVQKKVDTSKHIFVEDVLDVLEIEKKESEKESED